MVRTSPFLLLLALPIVCSRDRIPTHAHVTLDTIKHETIRSQSFTDESIAGRYGRSIQAHLSSLIAVIERDEAFHLDALVYTFGRAREALDRLERSERGPKRIDTGDFDLLDYELILRNISSPESPGINVELVSSASLLSFQTAFKSNFDIIYVKDIFDDWTLREVRKEISRLWASKDIEPNCNLNGVDRLGGYVHLSESVEPKDQTSSLYSLIFGNEPLRLWISAVVGTTLFPSDFPIELREYGNQSRGMACHSDVQMYADVEKNLEVVVTLSNHGQCEVSWFDRDGVKHSVWPAPNSITLVKPNAAVHCVSDTKGGFREILKFIMVGDYSKHRNFFDYVDNPCTKANPNVRALKKRRLERSPISRDEL